MNEYTSSTNNDNGFNYSYLVPLYVFGISGFYSVFMDSDHFIRCLPTLAWSCITGTGPKIFHTWIGAVLSIVIGVGCTLWFRYYNNLVDKSVGAPTIDTENKG